MLHLFDLDTVDEGLVKDGIDFDKENIAKNLTLFLYPDDSDEEGRKLRFISSILWSAAALSIFWTNVKEREAPSTIFLIMQ